MLIVVSVAVDDIAIGVLLAAAVAVAIAAAVLAAVIVSNSYCYYL